jgi:hypothetical protein
MLLEGLDQLSPRLAKPQPTGSIWQVAAGTRQAVELGHHAHIARQQGFHELSKLAPALCGLSPHFLTVDSGRWPRDTRTGKPWPNRPRTMG